MFMSVSSVHPRIIVTLLFQACTIIYMCEEIRNTHSCCCCCIYYSVIIPLVSFSSTSSLSVQYTYPGGGSETTMIYGEIGVRLTSPLSYCCCCCINYNFIKPNMIFRSLEYATDSLTLHYSHITMYVMMKTRVNIVQNSQWKNKTQYQRICILWDQVQNTTTWRMTVNS